jgi:hypothetical protein
MATVVEVRTPTVQVGRRVNALVDIERASGTVSGRVNISEIG